MLGAAIDAGGPKPLAFAEIGAGEEFAEREDAGERGADVVRVGDECPSSPAAAGLPRDAPRRAVFAADLCFGFTRAGFTRDNFTCAMAAPQPRQASTAWLAAG